MFAPLVVAVSLMCPPAEPEIAAGVPKPAAGKIAGRWTRDSGPVRFTLAFADGRMTATGFYSIADDDEPAGENSELTSFRIMLDADYSVNSEGMLYGVFTAVDSSPGCMAAMLQGVVGQPFAFRCRPGEDILGVADVKFMGHSSSGVMAMSAMTYSGDPKSRAADPMSELSGKIAGVVTMMAGRYAPDDGKPKPMPKLGKGKPAAVPPTVGAAIGSGVGAVIGSGTQLSGAVLPTGGTLPPQVLPPVTPQPPLTQQTGPQPLLSANLPPVAQAPAIVPPAAPTPALPPTANKLVGTWVKDKPGCRVTMKFAEQRLTMTCEHAIGEEKTGVERATLKIDADYAVGPDGLVFGVVTGCDADDADATDDTREACRKIRGSMFRFRVQTEDGVAVREVIVCGSDREAAGDETLADVLGGRFAAPTGKPLPPVKPAPAGRRSGGAYQGDPEQRTMPRELQPPAAVSRS